MIYEVNVYTSTVEVSGAVSGAPVIVVPEVDTIYPDILQWEIQPNAVIEPLVELQLWCDEAVLAELEDDPDIAVMTAEEAGAPWN